MYGPPLEPVALEDLERVIGGSRTAVIGNNWAIDAMLASQTGYDTGMGTGAGAGAGWLGMPHGDLVQDLYGHQPGHTEAPMYLDEDDLDLDNDLYDDPYGDPYRRG